MSRDAVVVGINRYQYLPNLQAPAQDAEAIAHCLYTYGDFRVNRLPEVIDQQRPKVGVTTPVTRQELETALIQLFKPKGKYIPSTALFYYSGHGLQKDAGIQEGYLATSDANPSQGMYGLSLFWLRRLLQESNVQQRIILLDCCHSGELLNFLEADPGANPGTDRLFMAASREYEAAYESLEGAYSVFTQALLTGLDPQPHGTVTNYTLTSWVSHALKGELQQPLFECSGREIVLTTDRQAHRSGSAPPQPIPVGIASRIAEGITPAVPPAVRCPFPGLQPLQSDDRSLLPCQADIAQSLCDRLLAHPQVILTGVSGSGKTSLLHQEFLTAAQAQSWQVRYLSIGPEPLQDLAMSFVDSTATGVERASQLQQAIALLEQGGTGLVQLCYASLGTATGMVLVIDHVESLLPQPSAWLPHPAGNHFATPGAYPFLRTLMEAASQQFAKRSLRESERIRILWCVRQDALAEWTHLTQIWIPDTPLPVVTLPLPTPEQIQYALTAGLAQVGVRLEPHLLYSLTLELRDARCVPVTDADSRSDPYGNRHPFNSRAAALPLLQMVLRELWHRQAGDQAGTTTLCLSAGTYAYFDGIRGLLHRHADAVLARLSATERAIAQRLFLALIHLRFAQRSLRESDQEATPIRVRKGDLLARVQASAPALSVLETLVTARLLVMTQHDVELSHPELARSWPQMQTWIAERRDILRLQQQVEQAAYEWQQTPTALNAPNGTAWTTQAPPSFGQRSPHDPWLQGDLLRAAVRHYTQCPEDFSPVAQRYIALSHREQQRLQRQTQCLRAIVPLVLLLALGSGLWQYRSQVQQEDQLRMARSRERVAIAQRILQDPHQDPTPALLISRLAVEEGERTPEAQASLRMALQRLQQLIAHQGELPPLQGLTQPVSWTAFIQPDTDFWQGTALDQVPTMVISEMAAADERLLRGRGRNGMRSPRAPVLVTATSSGQVQYWDVQTGTPLRSPFWLLQSRPVTATGQDDHLPTVTATAAHPNPLLGFALSPEGRWLATTQFSGRAGGQVNIYRLQPDQTFRLVHSLPQAVRVRQLAFSPLSNRLLGIDHDRVLIWDVSTGEQVQVLQGHEGAITQARFSHDGAQVATSSWDQTIALWQVNTGTLIQRWSHDDGVTTVEFSPDDRVLVFGGQEGTLARINLDRAGTPHVLQHLDTAITDVQFDPSGRSLMTTQANGLVQFWDAQTGAEQGQLPPLMANRTESGVAAPPTAIQQISQSPDGQYLTTLQADGQVTAWTASWDSLLALARDRSLRQLTPDECWQYLKLSATACPVLSLGDAVQVAQPPTPLRMVSN